MSGAIWQMYVEKLGYMYTQVCLIKASLTKKMSASIGLTRNHFLDWDKFFQMVYTIKLPFGKEFIVCACTFIFLNRTCAGA